MPESTVYSILETFDLFYRMAVLPLVILVGIFGQLITIKIFLTIKNWDATCKVYFLTLAIADLVYLLSLAFLQLQTELLNSGRKKTNFDSNRITFRI